MESINSGPITLQGRDIMRKNYGGIRKYGRGSRPGRWNIGAITSTALRLGRRYMSRSTQTRSNRSRDYGNITFQNDEQQLYRRKRAPRRVRKVHRRAFKNFMYNLDRLQGMRTVTISRTSSQSITPNSGADAQGAFGVTIYGYGENSATPGTNTNWGNGDIAYIFTAENTGAPSTTLASRMLRFRSARMNVTIKNVTDSIEGGGLVMIDMYHIVVRKDCDSTTNGGDPVQLWRGDRKSVV